MPRLGFTVEQVRSFVAVADTASITTAARGLYLSQAAVTQQVRNFERALGLALLERGGGRIRLTAAGDAVADSCRTALRALEAVQDAARSASSLATGSLQLGATSAVAAVYLPPLLARFTAGFPGIDVAVHNVNLRTALEQVHEGALDCAIVEGPVSRAGLVELAVAEDILVVVASPGHPLAGASSLDPRDLIGHRYLAREPGAAIELFAAEMLAPAHATAPRIELGHMDAVHGAVLAGLGYAVLPEVVVDRDLSEGRLVRLALPSRRRAITAVRRPPRGSPALEEFWRTVQAGVEAGR